MIIMELSTVKRRKYTLGRINVRKLMFLHWECLYFQWLLANFLSGMQSTQTNNMGTSEMKFLKSSGLFTWNQTNAQTAHCFSTLNFKKWWLKWFRFLLPIGQLTNNCYKINGWILKLLLKTKHKDSWSNYFC